jgi:hypothetical protein
VNEKYRRVLSSEIEAREAALIGPISIKGKRLGTGAARELQ